MVFVGGGGFYAGTVYQKTVLTSIRGQGRGAFIAGRNMREVEARESDLTSMVGFGIILLLLVTLSLSVLKEALVQKIR